MIKWVALKYQKDYLSFSFNVFNKEKLEKSKNILKKVYDKSNIYLLPSRYLLNQYSNTKDLLKNKQIIFYNETSNETIARILSKYASNIMYHLVICGFPNNYFGKWNQYIDFLDILKIKPKNVDENSVQAYIKNNYKFNEWTKLYAVEDDKNFVYYTFGTMNNDYKLNKSKSNHKKYLNDIKGVKIWVSKK